LPLYTFMSVLLSVVPELEDVATEATIWLWSEHGNAYATICFQSVPQQQIRDALPAKPGCRRAIMDQMGDAEARSIGSPV